MGSIETKCVRCGNVKIIDGIYKSNDSGNPIADKNNVLKDESDEYYQNSKEEG